MWIKYRLFPQTPADILISDHMNDGKNLTERMKDTGLFEKCIYAETFTAARKLLPETFTPRNRFYPDRLLKKIVNLPGRYKHIFVGNLDYFARLVYNAQSHKFLAAPKLNLFEDGLGSYCSNTLEWGKGTSPYYSHGKLKTILRKIIYRDKELISSLSTVYAFEPEKMMWNPPKAVKIPEIDHCDKKFLEKVNYLFSYNEAVSEYKRKYIFLEESFFAENLPINDIELVEKLAERIGKDNIIVKIHPRNKVNRFAKKGFMTNKNTAIPWEVIVMNMSDMSEKVLITIASSSIINPLRLFGLNFRTYSLYNLVSENIRTSSFLTGDLWKLVKGYIDEDSSKITICDSIDEIL